MRTFLSKTICPYPTTLTVDFYGFVFLQTDNIDYVEDADALAARIEALTRMPTASELHRARIEITDDVLRANRLFLQKMCQKYNIDIATLDKPRNAACQSLK